MVLKKGAGGGEKWASDASFIAPFGAISSNRILEQDDKHFYIKFRHGVCKLFYPSNNKIRGCYKISGFATAP